MNRHEFSYLLRFYMKREGYNARQIEQLTDIPKRTINRWIDEEKPVSKPRAPEEDLLRLAQCLRLSEAEATDLLLAAGKRGLSEIRVEAEREESEAMLEQLAYWKRPQTLRRARFPRRPPPRYFVGHQKEIDWLRGRLCRTTHAGPYCLIGMQGVGKTTLAEKIADEMDAEYPDGVVWIEVGRSADLATILNYIAAAYRLVLDNHPEGPSHLDLQTRVQKVRNLLVKKRALVIFNDVTRAEQIDSLLLANSLCAFLVTSRQRDLNLFLDEHVLEVMPFNAEGDETLALFTHYLSAERVREEAAILREIGGLVEHLPLAVDMLAARLQHDPAVRKARTLRDFLKDESARLEQLDHENRSVRMAFEASLTDLDEDIREGFVLLGLFATEGFAVEAVAHVIGLSTAMAAARLWSLFRVSLLQRGILLPYRLHSLLRDFTRERLGDDREAVGRFIDYYVNYAESYQGSPTDLRREQPNLLEALELTYRYQYWQDLARLGAIMAPHLRREGLFEHADRHLGRMLEAAQALDDIALEAETHRLRANLKLQQGEYAAARAEAELGLVRAWATEQPPLVGALHISLGQVLEKQGELPEARAQYDKGLPLVRFSGKPEQLLDALKSSASVAHVLDDLGKARVFLQEAIILAETHGDRRHLASLHSDMGWLETDAGDREGARKHLEYALDLARQIDHLDQIVGILINLSHLALEAEEWDVAVRHANDGLTQAQRHDYHHPEQIALLSVNLAIARGKLGQDKLAEATFEEALATARGLNHRWLIGWTSLEAGLYYAGRRRHEEAKQAFLVAKTLAEQLPDNKLERAVREGLDLLKSDDQTGC
jgi:tetratricopeptide (TPR) repeat protein